MTPFYVLFETNDAYAPLAGTAVYSLFMNNRDIENLEVYLVDDGISPENREKYLAVSREFDRPIHFVDPAPMERKLREADVSPYKGSYTTYYKLFTINLLPDDADKVLFIDSDTVIDANIRELLDWDFQGAVLAMTKETALGDYKVHLGMKKTDPFYNGGAILFNVPAWRAQRYEERILEYMQTNHPKFLFADQELLNVLFRTEIQPLPLKYNVHTSYFLYTPTQLYSIYQLTPALFYTPQEIAQAKDAAVVYHMVGNTAFCRPWHSNNHHPLTGIFDEYLAKTPWRDYHKKPMQQNLTGRLQYLLYRTCPKGLYCSIHRAMLRHWLTHAEKA